MSRIDGIIEDVKPKPEYIEGPEAAGRFQKAMKGILAVPHAEIQKRIEEHRQEAAHNPHKRGPKPKKRGASRGPDAS